MNKNHSVNVTESYTKRTLPKARGVMIAAINLALFAVILFLLFAYIRDNNKSNYDQNIENITNVAVAKSALAQNELESSKKLVSRAYNYCIGKTYEQILDYLSIITEDGSEYLLLTREINSSGSFTSAYVGHAITNGETLAIHDVSYSTSTALGAAIYNYEYVNTPDGVVKYTPKFTNIVNALPYYAPFCGLTINDGEQDVQYFLIKPQQCLEFLDKLSFVDKYDNLSTAVVIRDGNYLVADSSFKSSSFQVYIKNYNDLTLTEANAVWQDVITGQNETGKLEFLNSRKNVCTFVYSECNSGSNWYVICCVPNEDFIKTSVAFEIVMIIIVLVVLLTFDSAMYVINLARLNKSIVREKFANEAKSSFLAHMSHEMRTPLNAISGVAKLIENEEVSPTVNMLLGKINIAAAHLLGIINDVLDISKIGDGKMTIHYEEFAMKDIVDSLAIMYGQQSKEHSISLMFDSSFQDEYLLRGDPLRLRQILMNLISNAVKYNDRGGFVKVRIHDLGPIIDNKVTMYFEVEDNGFGISPQQLEHMFEPFTRDYTDRTKSISGTGLGLAINQQLVELMGSKLQAESTPDVGSKFFFQLTFEIGGKKVDKVKKTHAEWNKRTLEGKRILLVEDNEMNSFIAKNLLENIGATVDMAMNGKDGFEMLTKQPEGYYDLILMDILMPIMDGIETADAIRALHKPYTDNIPIVALSANAFSEDIEKSLEHGMQAHIRKPIDTDELFQTIVDLTVGKR